MNSKLPGRDECGNCSYYIPVGAGLVEAMCTNEDSIKYQKRVSYALIACNKFKDVEIKY